MHSTQSIPADRQVQVILDSIREQRKVQLTYNDTVGWRTYKGVWWSGSPEMAQAVIRIEVEPPAETVTLPTARAQLGGMFRLGHKKCMFQAALKAVDARPDGAFFTIDWPGELKQLQRRAYERAAPPPEKVIAVRFWHEAESAGLVLQDRTVRHGQLEDISCGGLRIKVAHPHDITIGMTYRCAFTPKPGKPAIVVDAILRHRDAGDQGRASLGFQFVGLEQSEEGTKILDRLARLVGHFQRAASRRTPRRRHSSAGT